MKNFKTIVLGLLCLFILILIIVVVNRDKEEKELKSQTQYIIIDSNYWKYEKSNWIRLDAVLNSTSVYKEVNWQSYDVYVGNDYYGTYNYVFTNNKDYYFDSDDNSYDIDGEKILLNEETYFKLKDFSSSDLDVNDNDIVSEFLDEFGYSDDNLSVLDKYIFDDGVVYVVSNYSSSSNVNSSNLFYISFYRKDKNNYLLFNIGYDEYVSDYELAWILDVDKELDNFILSYTCEEMICYQMYEYENSEYVKVIET